MTIKLAEQITTIITNNGNKNILKSYKIIDNLIRSKKIFVPKCIVDNWDKEKATLNYKDCKSEIEANEFTLYYEISANTIGPLYPDDYFDNKVNPLILFLLKEPFIEKDSWHKNDRGGHNQVDVWLSRAYTTQQKALGYANMFLSEMNIQYDNVEDYLKHICVINVQLYPGLAFKKSGTNDSLLKPWALENQNLIEILIDFFNPKYIVGGQTLKNYFLDKHKDETILGEEIIYRNLQLKNYYFITKSGRIFIDANHPSASQFKIIDGKNDAKVIKEILLKTGIQGLNDN